MATIFLGNGINRTESLFSWSDLLTELVAKCGLGKIPPPPDMPFPLFFESILLRSKTSEPDLSSADFSLRTFVADMCLKLTPNDLSRKLASLGIRDIVTTNYDYVLEDGPSRTLRQSADPDIGPETDYRIHTYNQIEGRRIWHIHGEAGYPRTMVLGHDMYARNISKMSAYVEKRGYDRLFAENPSSKNTICWMDLLFHSDVHIIGFALDYSEIDVWWALNLRARLIKDFSLTGRSFQSNRVFYHMRKGAVTSEMEMLMESHFIETIIDDQSPDYSSHYRRVLDRIQTSSDPAE